MNMQPQQIFNYVDVEPEYVCHMKFGSLNNDAGVPASDVAITEEPVVPAPRKRGRPPKKKLSEEPGFVPANETKQEVLPKHQSNEMYVDSYQDTNMMLRGTIMQVDQLQGDIKRELDGIRSSRTLKKKYDYLAMLSSTASTLIGTKVSAIKEMNKVITDTHNLELKRMRDLKVNEVAVDDDKRMMDMYQAFISTPVGGNGGGAGNMLGPSITDMTLMTGIQNMVRADIGDTGSYEHYTQNLTPSQNMMRLENNPDNKTVVVYDPETGRRWFDVMNTRTGESIPNVNTPDPMFLEDTVIDVRNAIARNTNLDISYPLIVLNNSNLREY